MCSTEKGWLETLAGLRQYSQRSPARSSTCRFNAAETRRSFTGERADPQAIHHRFQRDATQARQLIQMLDSLHVEGLDLVRQAQQLGVLFRRE